MPEIALDTLRELIREEIRTPRKRRTDPRHGISCQVTADELTAIQDAAAAKGLCIADLIRLGLEAVTSLSLPRNRFVPIGLQEGQRARQEAVLKDAMRKGIIAKRQLRQTGAAVSQTASVPIPKLRGPQRPE